MRAHTPCVLHAAREEEEEDDVSEHRPVSADQLHTIVGQESAHASLSVPGFHAT